MNTVWLCPAVPVVVVAAIPTKVDKQVTRLHSSCLLLSSDEMKYNGSRIHFSSRLAMKASTEKTRMRRHVLEDVWVWSIEEIKSVEIGTQSLAKLASPRNATLEHLLGSELGLSSQLATYRQAQDIYMGHFVQTIDVPLQYCTLPSNV